MKQGVNVLSRMTACMGLIFVLSTELSAADLNVQISSCNACHGEVGVSKSDAFPSIAGLSSIYIIDSFAAYKDRLRPCEQKAYLSGPRKGEKDDMCRLGDTLSPQQIKLLADYYAGQPFVQAIQPFDPQLAKRGASLHQSQCAKCHEAAGSVADDDSGILAGQWMGYMQQQFDAYTSGKRAMPEKMKQKMDKLTAEDSQALIHYYGSFQGQPSE